MLQSYADAQKMIMEYAAFVPVHDQTQTIAYTSSIDGLRFAPGNWQVRLYDVRPAE
jgi:peptide/nickel transport system substrate-binding protein